MTSATRASTTPDLDSYPPFSLTGLLSTVFDPQPGDRVALLIDLRDINEIKGMRFLNDPTYSIQRHAIESFYNVLKKGALAEMGLVGGDLYAYAETGGSNLDLPDDAMTPAGEAVSLEMDVYPNYDIILCISTFSATAPLTAFAKQYGFRGATMHGMNDIILSTGLCVDYRKVSADAEKLRLSMSGADFFEADFECGDQPMTLKLLTHGQSAQKSHGLCRERVPDIANLPAGEVYFIPEGAEGEFPLKYEDGTLGRIRVTGGRIEKAHLIKGNAKTIEAHNRKLSSDPVTGVLGELGFGTQMLPFSGRDIQDEKVLGTFHVATGRSDHLGGTLTPDLFLIARNATHDDILFAPHKTPEIKVPQVRMFKNGETTTLIEHYEPSAFIRDILAG
ncbi:MAG: hypothetical protein O3C57_00130 [Verrucomicrobia bacterium]|nr:hypothetical protein [Verrucomicrobiota bacterium]